MSDSGGLDSKYRSSRRQPQSQHADPVKCPRCESPNTKFCYYNNYNKTQPRHFCKACKRYWTKGGTLRNVPIGGGRKNKRLMCPNSTSATAVTVVYKPSIDHQDSLLLGLSDSKDASSDVGKDSFFKPAGSEKSDDVESYTDIEELKGLVSWDFYGSFVSCTKKQLPQDDHPSLGFSEISSTFETNPSSDLIEMFENDHCDNSIITTASMIGSNSQQWQFPITSNFLEINKRNWNELDEDLNKPWEDPTFKT